MTVLEPRTFYVNQGQLELASTGASTAKIAAAVGCSREAARLWRLGRTVPTDEWRPALLAGFGIDPRSWERRANPAAVSKRCPTCGAGRPAAAPQGAA